MTPLPINAPGPDNDLDEKIGQYVERAMADEAPLSTRLGSCGVLNQKSATSISAFYRAAAFTIST